MRKAMRPRSIIPAGISVQMNSYHVENAMTYRMCVPRKKIRPCVKRYGFSTISTESAITESPRAAMISHWYCVVPYSAPEIAIAQMKYVIIGVEIRRMNFFFMTAATWRTIKITMRHIIKTVTRSNFILLSPVEISGNLSLGIVSVNRVIILINISLIIYLIFYSSKKRCIYHFTGSGGADEIMNNI